MKKKYKKIIWPLVGVAAVVSIAAPIIVLSAKKKDKKAELNKIEEPANYNQLVKFPKINLSDFQHYIQLEQDVYEGNSCIEGYKGYIDDKFINAVIFNVVKNTEYNKGTLDFDFYQENKKMCEIKFVYKYKDKKITKIYSFIVKHDNDMYFVDYT